MSHNGAPGNSAPNNPDNGDTNLTDYPDYSTGWESLTALTVGLVNQDEDLKEKARFMGDNRSAERINEHKGIRGLIDKIWRGGVARSYYRQKNINAARQELLDARTLALDYNENERRRYNRSVCKAFVSDADGVIDEEAGDSRESLAQRHPDLHAQIMNIVSSYADGSITDIEDASRQFDEAINGFRDEHGNEFGEGHLSVSNIRDVAIEARQRFENLTTVADAVHSKMEHDDAMERVMAGFDVLYGNRSNDHLSPKYNKVDKIIDRLQESKIGQFVTPETISLAAGAAMSVAEFFGKKVTSTVFAAVPGLSAAVLGGLKAGTTFEQERFRAEVDVRYNREFDPQQKRREEVMNTLHDHHNVNELIQDLQNRAQTIDAMQANGEDIGAQRDELLMQVARIKTYLDLEKGGNSVLSFTSELDAPDEKLDLLVRFGEAKSFLKANGIDDLDDRLNASSELMQNVVEDIEGNIEDADKRARKTKVKRILKKGALGLVTGAAIGMATQEVSAFFNPNVKGIFEDGSQDNIDAQLTAGRRLATMLGWKGNTTFTATDDLANRVITDSSKDYDFAQQQDGSISLIKNGQEVAKNIQWDPKTGTLSQQTIDELKARGIDVTTTGNNLTHSFQTAVQRTRTVSGSVKDALAASGETTNVSRVGWYDNNSETPDLNELGLQSYIEPGTGKVGMVSNMTSWGSFTGNRHVNFFDLANSGQLKAFVSMTRDTQMTPIEMIVKVLPSGQVSMVPADGSLAEQCFAPDGTFLGKFCELAQVVGVRDGKELIMPLATEVGNGLADASYTESFTDYITETIDIPEYLFTIQDSLMTQFPMLFPIVPDGAMNASEMSRYTRRRGHRNRRIPGYGYNYSYSNDYGEGNDGELESHVKENRILNAPTYDIVERPEGGVIDDTQELTRLGYGDISPTIMQRRELELGNEVARYTDKVRQEMGDDYADNLEQNVESSEELRNLDNNVKTIVTIPIHAPTEANNIYGTLSLYAQQENVDFNSMVLLLDMNWRENEPGDPADLQARIQATRDEIERARQDFPQLRIATFDQPGHHGIGEVARTVNDVALTAIDDAVKAGRMSNDNDVLIIRNDADIQNLDAHYISSYQEAARENPKTPLFTGTTWFGVERTKRAPGFGAVLTIERMNNLFGALNGTIHTAGANFAYRASSFAAVNGFGFGEDDFRTGAGTDDLKVGRRIANAYRIAYDERGDNSGNPADGDLMDPQSRLLKRVGEATISTDDTRYLKYYDPSNNLVTNDAYGPGGYNQNVLRPSDNFDNFSEQLDDPQVLQSTMDQFEREMSDYFTYEGGYSPQLARIISWFFDEPADQLFTLDEDTSLTRTDNLTPYRFTLTDLGRQQFRPVLERRFGTGNSTDDRNSLQRAITNGDFVSRRS